MATSRILLPIAGWDLPTANPAVRATITSSGGPTANTPLVTYQQLQFARGAPTDLFAMCTMRTPTDYLSGGILVVTLAASVNAGNIVMGGGLAPIIHASTLQPAAVFNACDVSATTAVPGTVGQDLDLSWVLTPTNMLGSRRFTVFLSRRATLGADTAAGQVNISAAAFEYNS